MHSQAPTTSKKLSELSSIMTNFLVSRQIWTFYDTANEQITAGTESRQHCQKRFRYEQKKLTVLIWNQKEERNLAFTQILHLHLNKWSSPVCLSGFLWLHLSFLFSKNSHSALHPGSGRHFWGVSSARCSERALIWAHPWGSATMKWTCLGTRCQDWGMTQRGVRDTWSAWRASGKLLPPFPRSEKTAADQHLAAILPYWLNLGHQSANTSWVKEREREQWAIPHLLWHRCSVYLSLTSVSMVSVCWQLFKNPWNHLICTVPCCISQQNKTFWQDQRLYILVIFWISFLLH